MSERRTRPSHGSIGYTGFVARVERDAGLTRPEAERAVRATLETLGERLPSGQAHHLAAQLPPIEQPERPPVVSADEFTDRVARRAGLDRGAARRVTEAVLEVLSERISGGQVDDLAQQLPDELYPPLQHGKIRSHGAARPLSPAEFVRRIAEHEGAPPDDAREHARAVLATLRESVSDKEFADTSARVPDDYRALLAPA